METLGRFTMRMGTGTGTFRIWLVCSKTIRTTGRRQYHIEHGCRDIEVYNSIVVESVRTVSGTGSLGSDDHESDTGCQHRRLISMKVLVIIWKHPKVVMLCITQYPI